MDSHDAVQKGRGKAEQVSRAGENSTLSTVFLIVLAHCRLVGGETNRQHSVMDKHRTTYAVHISRRRHGNLRWMQLVVKEALDGTVQDHLRVAALVYRAELRRSLHCPCGRSRSLATR